MHGGLSPSARIGAGKCEKDDQRVITSDVPPFQPGAAQVGARFVYASEVTSGKMAVGQFDPVQLEKTRDLYTQYLELKRKVGLEEIYTNDLLPAKK